MSEYRVVIDCDSLLEVSGLDGVAIFQLAECYLDKSEEGKVKLQYAGGELFAPSSPSMVDTIKKYKDGTVLKIKGKQYKTSCSTLYLTKSGRWSLETCINPIEHKGSCPCSYVVEFDFING